MKRYLETIRSEEAIAKILEHAKPIEDEEFLLTYLCTGRITTRPVFAKLSNPPFLCSAMDGYAASFEKTLDADLTTPVSLKKNVDVFPVNTGDPLPGGTNAVIMVEEGEESDTFVIIRKPAYLWQNVRMVGEDIIEGDMLIPRNHRIGAFETGMLIAGGVTHVHVRRKPAIFIIPTGKELIDIYQMSDETIKRTGLVDFNSYFLLRLAEDTGFLAEKSKIVFHKDELRNIVQEAVEKYDGIIINAGSSAGSEDFTESVIRELGTLIFHGVSMMPGKPTMFGIIKGKTVFGIPGYPVSAAISFKTFFEPLYERLSSTQLHKKYVTCITPYKIPSRIGIEEILRINLIEKKGKYYAFPLARGASIFSSMARADALIRIPEHIEGYDEDEEISCEMIREGEEIGRRIHIIGSHDLSLDILRDMMKGRHPHIDLISTHVGSLSGILAFRKGITELCTTHVIDENEKIYNIPVIKKYLPDSPWTLIHIAKRLQGLLVGKGNPKDIKDISDIARNDVKFVNRQFGSGTRILLDTMLKGKGITKESINGYEREESSHTAVGILVKESIADVGVAIYAMAKVFSLDFIPLVEEDYDLLVAKEFTEDKRFHLLMDLILSDTFKGKLNEIGGYHTEDTGKIKYVNG